MARIPFGVDRLDTVIKGGAPPGSVVLVSGEAGAGSREFLYTSAVMHGLAHGDHELFDLHYGDLSPNAELPAEIHYLTFTSSEEQVRDAIRMSMDEEIAEPGLENVRVRSFTEEFFHVSPVPRDWYAADTVDIKNLRDRHEERQELLPALGDALTNRAPGNLVVIDSLADLVGEVGDAFEWSDIGYLVRGLSRAAYSWGGLVLVHVNFETLSDTRLGQLSDATTGTMEFTWESGGSTRARTMVVKQFSGVLSRIEDENIVRFETELGDVGFDISDVRKIR